MERKREGATSEFWLHAGDADTAAAARVINIMEKREGGREGGRKRDCKKAFKRSHF